MKATITSTAEVVELDTRDNRVRVWKAKMEDGTECLLYIGLVQAVRDADVGKLERALLDRHPPADAATQQLIAQRDVAVRHCRAAHQALLYHPLAG